MKKYILLVFACCFSLFSFSQPLVDQDAKLILDKASQSLQKSTGDKAEFNLVVENAQTGNKQTIDGTILIKADKFKFSVSDVETYFNGITQWIYMHGSNEVSISTPTQEELQDINPTAIISSYKKGYKIKKDDDAIVNEKPVYVIDIYPEDRTKDFFRINIAIEKSTHNIVSISTYDKNGTTTTVKIKKYEKNLNLSDDVFVFDSKKFPKVEEIDLR